MAPSRMSGKCSRAYDVPAAGDGAEDLAYLGRVAHGHDLVAVHDGLYGAHGVGLGDDDLRPEARGAHGDALAAPAVAVDDHVLAGDDEVGGAHDGVPDALARAVAVVEEVLAVGVVDLDHGEGQQPRVMELAYPVYAARRLLAAAYDAAAQLREAGAHGLQQVAAVVDDDVRPVAQDVFDVAEILLLARAVDRVDLYAAGGEGRGDVVLCGERIGAGDVHLRAAGGEHAAEVGRLGLQVYRKGDFHAGKGLFPGEVGLYAAQDGHIAPHPVYLQLAGRGQGYVFYLVHAATPHE